MSGTPFHGSYGPEDVTFLLKVIAMDPTPLRERERRIQSGQAHYSEMIGAESPPSEAYLRVFHDSVRRDGPVMARHLALLAALVASRRPEAITLASLARAGTPVGVLLARILRRYFHRTVRHYSISIIRDRGIDEKALDHIIRRDGCSPSSITFVDGWTAKGVIARELAQAVSRYNRKTGLDVSPDLYVLTDICGEAGVAPSREDFLIPSSILNSIVSGLISRTILHADHISPDDFHGCLYYNSLEPHDLSRWFVDTIMDMVHELHQRSPIPALPVSLPTATDKKVLRQSSDLFLERILRERSLPNANHVKPGLGETTRVLLRRVPDAVLLRDPHADDVQHLRLLATEKDVPITHDPTLPYRAAALIKVVSDA